MSADNWTDCPKCYKVCSCCNRESETSTLREDYEIGIKDKVFFVKYRSVCKSCGFVYNYDHEVPIE